MTDRVAVFAISSEDMGMGRANLSSPSGREEQEGEGKYGDRNLLVRPLKNADGSVSSDIRGNLYTKIAFSDDFSCMPTPSEDLCKFLAGGKNGSRTVSKEISDFIAETAWNHVNLDKAVANSNLLVKTGGAINRSVNRIYFGGQSNRQSGGGPDGIYPYILGVIDGLRKSKYTKSTPITDIMKDSTVVPAVNTSAAVTDILEGEVDDTGKTILQYLTDKGLKEAAIKQSAKIKLDAYYRDLVETILTDFQQALIKTKKDDYAKWLKEAGWVWDGTKVKVTDEQFKPLIAKYSGEYVDQGNLALAKRLDSSMVTEDLIKKEQAKAVKGIVTKVAQDEMVKVFAAGHVTVSKSQHAKDLLENVYKRWNYLTDETQSMYTYFLSILERSGKPAPDDWKVIDPSEYDRKFNPTCDVSQDNLRINLNKQGVTGETRFEESIPLIPLSRFDLIEFTGPDDVETRKLVSNASQLTGAEGARKVTSVKTGGAIGDSPGNRVLRDIYNSIYAYGMFNVNSTSVSSVDGKSPSTMVFPDKNSYKTFYSGNNMFSFKTNDLVRNMLYDLARADRTTRKPSDVDDSFFGPSGYLDMIDANTWSRVSPGVYQKVDASGKTVRYGREDEATKRMFKSGAHGCYTTLYNAPAADCDKYIHQCLLDGNKDSMATCLAAQTLKPEFFKNSKKGINDMHPLIALRTLQKFGFREHDIYDNQAGTTIRKIESVEHWKNSDFMKERFKNKDGTVQEIDGILTQYLELVSEFVNSNPGILNSGFRGQTDEGVGHLVSSDYVRSLGIKQRVEPSRGKGKFYSRLGTHMKTSMYGNSYAQAPFRASASGFASPFGAARTPGITGILRGGADSGVILRGFNEASDAPHGAVFISEVVKSALNDLRNSGRYIKNDDLRHIDSTLNRISKDEEKLLKLVAMIEQYNRMMESHKDYKVEGLSLNKLEEMVDKYSKVAGRYFNDQQAVQVLLSAFEKQSPDQGREIDMVNHM